MNNRKKIAAIVAAVIVVLIAITVVIVVKGNKPVAVADIGQKSTEHTTVKENNTQKSTQASSSQASSKENKSSTQVPGETLASEVTTQGNDTEGVTQVTTPNVTTQQTPADSQNSDANRTPEPQSEPQPEQSGNENQGRVELTELKAEVDEILQLEGYYDFRLTNSGLNEAISRFDGYAAQFCAKQINAEYLKETMVSQEIIFVSSSNGKKYSTHFIDNVSNGRNTIYYVADIVDVTGMPSAEIAHMIFTEWCKGYYKDWENAKFANVDLYPWYEYFKLYEENGQTYLYSTWGFTDVVEEL